MSKLKNILILEVFLIVGVLTELCLYIVGVVTYFFPNLKSPVFVSQCNY